MLSDLESLPDRPRPETVWGLQNAEGKQLMLEAIALLGALLLALDRQIHGAARERIVVAYYRLKGGAQVHSGCATQHEHASSHRTHRLLGCLPTCWQTG